MSKYAVALAGGGSKDIYQVGAWKALDEMGIEFEAVTDTSSGMLIMRRMLFFILGHKSRVFRCHNNRLPLAAVYQIFIISVGHKPCCSRISEANRN